MKRLIISLGLVWALIYTANHTVFVGAASDTGAKVASSAKQASTDRRIDSWGPYLPNVRPPLPDENPTASPSNSRQPREVAARQIETDPASTADTSPPPKKETSDVGAKARGERSKKASIDGSIFKKSAAASPKAKKSHRPEMPGLRWLKHRYPKGWRVRASAAASASLCSLHQASRRNVEL